MILIFSKKNEYATDQVINWLLRMNQPFIRINESDRIEIKSVDFSTESLIFSVCNQIYDLKDFKSVWYRRGGVKFTIREVNSDLQELSESILICSDNLKKEINKCSLDDIGALNRYFIYQLSTKRSINSFNKSSVNKLIVLSIAKDIGILIPESRVVSSLQSLKDSSYGIDTAITKSIKEGVYKFTDQEAYYGYTETVAKVLKGIDGDAYNFAETFLPSLIQKKINKRYELRIFFFDQKFYSLAIFSQNSIATSIDSRKYSNNKPSRTIPYNLPAYVSRQLTALMSKLTLTSGSIDMIVDNEGQYIFLEVNPVGQFSVVEDIGNFGLYKIIAKFLSDGSKY